ncbi:ABC transporter ATP-binding protein [Inmirania thermothiophila]|uniref:ABC-type dipeptide transporter n=1 Tax=Inmirania thermothiophila TaxID=1750597 RepID=A0A3N1XZH4_9GAMM|nr:ABC transporter ATP-binding protein [Inmirania thermothiophila]ROR32004.1 peptide/nickel transport system ATP-binding protein [Inmirania thermothiophila]
MSAEALLEVRGLAVRIGEGARAVRPVDGVDLAVRRGEVVALLGESGCGKSMTALALMRLLPEPGGRVVAGSVRLAGEELLTLPEHAMRRLRGGRMAMIFQEPMTALNPVLTVGRQIMESLAVHRGLRGTQARAQAAELLAAVGIPDPAARLDAWPHQLSGGMKQRVMIAMALAGEPELLIADEPTTALDVTIQAQVLDLLRRLQRERGMGMLLITHDLGVVAQTADRVAVMYAGEIVEEAPRGRFFHHHAHPYTARLFAALPDPARRGEPLAVIPGMVPPLDRPFEGCRFAPRCARADGRCRAEAPDWRRLADDHRVRCHHPAEPAPARPPRPAPAAGTAAAGTLLEVEGLRVHFPVRRGPLRRPAAWVRAVDGVDLALAAGETVALVGESGCGKTTVGKAILRLVEPTAGRVRFDGVELTTLPARALRRRRRALQMIFQDPYASMNPRMRVGDIVAEGMVVQGVGGGREGRRRRVAELLEAVGLPPEAAARFPHEFSGGQRQRICIARALAVEPRLVVCDEPTSALDVSVQAQILNLLRELQGRLGLAYLFITHNLAVVGYLAQRVAVMYLGRIVEEGGVEAVLTRPAHPYTQALLAAVPRPVPGREAPALRLAGEPPSPLSPPAGCPFHPRCPEARPACARALPAVRELGTGHRVRCLLY